MDTYSRWLRSKNVWALILFGILWLLWQIFTDELAGIIREFIPEGGLIMYGITHPYIIMPSLLILFGIYALIQSKKVIEKDKNEKHISDLLWKMYNRMMDFVDIRAKQDIDESKVRRAMTISADKTGVVKLEDKDDVTKDLLKQLGLGTRLPKSEKKKEELSLRIASLTQSFPMPEKQWELADLIKIGESLDGEKIGLGELRDSDKKWQHWHKKLTSIQRLYADEQLDKLISTSIFISYGCCSQLLYVTYLYRYESNEILKGVLSLVRGVTANIKVQIDDAIRDSIRPITNRIQELLNQEDSKSI